MARFAYAAASSRPGGHVSSSSTACAPSRRPPRSSRRSAGSPTAGERVALAQPVARAAADLDRRLEPLHALVEAVDEVALVRAALEQLRAPLRLEARRANRSARAYCAAASRWAPTAARALGGRRSELEHRLRRRRRPRRGGRAARGRAAVAARERRERARGAARRARAGAIDSSIGDPRELVPERRPHRPPRRASPRRGSRRAGRVACRPSASSSHSSARGGTTATASSSAAAAALEHAPRGRAPRRGPWAGIGSSPAASTSVTKNGLPAVRAKSSVDVDAVRPPRARDRVERQRRRARRPLDAACGRELAEHDPQRVAAVELVVAVAWRARAPRSPRRAGRAGAGRRASPRRPSGGPRARGPSARRGAARVSSAASDLVRPRVAPRSAPRARRPSPRRRRANGAERPRREERVARAPEDARVAAALVAEPADERRLADPGLARDEHEPTGSTLDLP